MKGQAKGGKPDVELLRFKGSRRWRGFKMRWPPKNRTIRHSWRFKAATGTGVKRNETCSLNEVMIFHQTFWQIFQDSLNLELNAAVEEANQVLLLLMLWSFWFYSWNDWRLQHFSESGWKSDHLSAESHQIPLMTKLKAPHGKTATTKTSLRRSNWVTYMKRSLWRQIFIVKNGRMILKVLIPTCLPARFFVVCRSAQCLGIVRYFIQKRHMLPKWIEVGIDLYNLLQFFFLRSTILTFADNLEEFIETYCSSTDRVPHERSSNFPWDLRKTSSELKELSNAFQAMGVGGDFWGFKSRCPFRGAAARCSYGCKILWCICRWICMCIFYIHHSIIIHIVRMISCK